MFFSKRKKKQDTAVPKEKQTAPVKAAAAPQVSAPTPAPVFQYVVTPPEPEIPPLQGDYAKTIFLWVTSKAPVVDRSFSYPGYLLYECGIRNTAQYLESLFAEGFYREAVSAERLSALKVTELKPLLAELGLPVSGKKDALIQRILDHSDDSFVLKHCPNPIYSLSAKGRAFLDEHDDYVKLHTHKWSVSWQEYDARKRPGYSFYDVMWGIFNERVLEEQHNFGINAYRDMYQLLVEEGRRSQAIEMLLRIIYIDWSGAECLESREFLSKRELKDDFESNVLLAPGIAQDIASYKDVYSDEMIDRIYEWKLPLQICSKRLFTSIVHSALDGTYDEAAVRQKLKRAYNKAIDAL